ncbi:hypothetical protein NEUTE1DRAFT_140370 [Neurospora tetrasperma FGSC 2508]|uniref:Uncharacterized protein n=1 Tax=Neurospora tetrasperma (strain FGSC 2508 / ATCC MYA-4615 / P0657) TaxID=510951 RepID=F8MW27_NEUT8|nr:uncharacterized protein NEUTE1DRAFT_140370 [Neurospora tetrasperma FGSC 2508]EGO54022.1 hypothetical protein NEUTE1DRAFT_140370 [Neurospora tetrasperma FGSC 2508]
MSSNDVLILREAIRKLLNKMEENKENTTDETNAVVENIARTGKSDIISSVWKSISSSLAAPCSPNARDTSYFTAVRNRAMVQQQAPRRPEHDASVEVHRYWRDAQRLRLVEGDAGYANWSLAKFRFRTAVK